MAACDGHSTAQAYRVQSRFEYDRETVLGQMQPVIIFVEMCSLRIHQERGQRESSGPYVRAHPTIVDLMCAGMSSGPATHRHLFSKSSPTSPMYFPMSWSWL